MCKKDTKPKNRLPDGDDGRTIANMNVDGMPWYVKKNPDQKDNTTPPTKEELKIWKNAALKAALLIGGIFGAVFAVFILFCQFVWFK